MSHFCIVKIFLRREFGVIAIVCSALLRWLFNIAFRVVNLPLSSVRQVQFIVEILTSSVNSIVYIGIVPLDLNGTGDVDYFGMEACVLSSYCCGTLEDIEHPPPEGFEFCSVP